MKILRIFQAKYILLVLLCHPLEVALEGLTLTWNGQTSCGLLVISNWTPNALPLPTDTANFGSIIATACSTPTDSGPANFTPTSIGFLSGAPSYTVIFSSTGGLQMFSNGSLSNTSGILQLFNFTSSSISKLDGVTIDSSGSSIIEFNFSSSSELMLQGTTANTTTASSIFNASGTSSIMFLDSSVAGRTSSGFQTTINGYNSSLIDFDDASDPNNAIINLHQLSSVTFDTSIGTSGNGGPLITLFNDATVNVLRNISIATLNSNSKGTTVALGANTLTINQPTGEHDTYAGEITGTGQLTLSDSDPTDSLRLTSSQNPADIWKANVVSGILIGNTSNLNRALAIGANGTVVFDQTSNGVYNQSRINGTGTLDIAGPASMKITSNNSSFAGTTNVQNENLILNGSLGGQINVYTKLTGNGIASGTVTVKNGGTISPNGNKIGTLTVGDYVNSVDGIYKVNVNGSGNSDLIHATTTNTNGTGKATLHGGIVVPKPINHQFLANFPYTIVTAQNGVFGTYTAATSFSPVIQSILSYDTNHVFLTFKSNFEVVAHTHNQRAVARQLDSIQGSSILVDDLAFLTPGQIRNALDQLSGEQYTALIPTLQQTNQRFIRSINLPIRLNMRDPCECQPSEFEGIWGDIQYGKSFTKSDNNAKGYSVKSYDGFFAVQKQMSSCFTGGLAVYYEDALFDFDLNGNAHMNTALGSIFGVMHDDCFYLLGDIVLGYSFTKLKRRVEFDDFRRSPKSDPKVYDAAFYAEFGANLGCLPCLILQPFAAVELDYFYRRRFRENNGGIADLKSENQEYREVDTFVGLRSKAILCGGFELIAEAAWQHRYTDEFDKIKLHFTQFGNQFTIIGPKQGKNAISGSVILALNAEDGRKIFGEVYGESQKHYSDYGFSLGFDMNW